jgi:hypothetical protein
MTNLGQTRGASGNNGVWSTAHILNDFIPFGFAVFRDVYKIEYIDETLNSITNYSCDEHIVCQNVPIIKIHQIYATAA